MNIDYVHKNTKSKDEINKKILIIDVSILLKLIYPLK